MTNSNIKKTIPSTYRQLYRLENLDDWKVHHDDTDIRKYTAKTSDGKTIGEVENLLVDTEAKKVRYVEVELEKDLPMIQKEAIGSYTERDGDRIVIVPVGLVQINKDQKSIDVTGLTRDHFRTYPRYTGRTHFGPDYERKVYDHLIGPAGDPAAKHIHDDDEQNTPAVATGVDFDRSVYDSPYFRDSKYRRSAMRTTMTGIV